MMSASCSFLLVTEMAVARIHLRTNNTNNVYKWFLLILYVVLLSFYVAIRKTMLCFHMCLFYCLGH